jgi:hypothetical protein
MIPANTIKDSIILNTRIYANDLDINSASLIAWFKLDRNNRFFLKMSLGPKGQRIKKCIKKHTQFVCHDVYRLTRTSNCNIHPLPNVKLPF